MEAVDQYLKKSKGITNRGIILFFFGFSMLIIITLLGLSCFAFLKPEHYVHIQDSIIGVLLAIMSLIIMLGVAFSFVSIFDAKGDIQRLTNSVNEYRDTKRQVDDMLKELNDYKKKSQLALAKCEIYSLDMAATSFYFEKRYLQAIKKEFEVLDYIIKHKKSCEDISKSYWGMKRYAISNDIRQQIFSIMNYGMPKFSIGELEDIMTAIFGITNNMETSEDFATITQGEFERYRSLIFWTKSLLSNLYRQQLNFAIDNEAYIKLYIYTKISDGSKPDSQVNIDGETERMLQSEFVAFENYKNNYSKEKIEV